MEAIKNQLAENFGGVAHNLATGSNAFTLDQVPDLSGKVALVTGGSEGIGFGVTHTLLAHNIKKVYILTKTKEKADDAFDAIEEELGKGVRERIDWRECDLQDWMHVASTASDIAKNEERLDILINNAGRGIMTQQMSPAHGIDLHMACNHFGHVILTSHLMPLMKKTADQNNIVRISCQSSSLHASAPSEVAFASVDELQKDYGPNAQYGRSKLANLLYARWMAKNLTPTYPNILINATHPGIVDTAQTNEHIHEAFPILGYGMSVGMKPFRKSQFEGCVSTMYAATKATESGQYINPPSIVEAGSPQSQDMELAQRLMDLTKEVIDHKTRAHSKGCPLTFY